MNPDRPANNFDALRFGAAVAVLVSHSVPLTSGSDGPELLYRWSHHQTTLGGVAVALFFIVSGYLIAQSMSRSRNPVRFVQHRALRLVPAMAAHVLIMAFLVGPLLTTLPLADYLTDARLPRFLANIVMVSSTFLPDVFAANPDPGVNGSLWTLPYEVQCYGVVLLLGVAGLLNKWTALALWLAATLAARLWLGGLHTWLGSLFLGGAVLYLWQPPMRAWAAAACVPVLLIGLFVTGWRTAAATAGVYLVLWVARAAPPVRLPWRGDLSYGIYLWAFPVQQGITMLLGDHATWWANIALSLPPTMLLAWASWHWVEAPALALRMQTKRAGDRPEVSITIPGPHHSEAGVPFRRQ